MHRYFWISVLIGIVGMGKSFSQSGIQLAFNYGMGRTYTQVDYKQADAQNLEGTAGLAVPLGIEIAWSPSPHWRIGAGISIIAYEARFKHYGALQNSRGDNNALNSIPVDISYRIFGDPERKKSFVFTLGGSYDLIIQSSGGSTSSSGWFRNGVEIGRTQIATFETTSDVNLSLRFGLAQEWRLGKKDRFSLQLYGLYSLGLIQIWGGDYKYWSESIPDGFDWGTPLIDIMPEPEETYDSMVSNGSYFTIGFKLYYTLTQE